MHKNSNTKITVLAVINPSESSEKLIDAIKNLVNMDIVKNNHLLSGSSFNLTSLQIIFDQVKSKSIFSVLRRLLLNNLENNSTFFLLNKQAATVNSVVLTENEQDSPLGTIKIIIEAKDIMEVVDSLAPESP
ncbi:MAG: hypothetical protein DA328_02945 [Nitrososphaeraceae archaeon]|nr:hypothetical protein [Nitrososphaeraceae archaeon]